MMRYSMTVFRNVLANGGVDLHGFTFRRVSGLLAVTSALVFSAAFAKEPVGTEAKSTSKGTAARAEAQTEPAAIPECFEKLKLTSQQQAQIKEVVRNYEGSITVVWNQFSDRYIQAIRMESTLLAAIEDNLTEAQRQQVRDQRRKTAQHEKAVAATNSRVNQATITKNEETTRPASAAEEGLAAVGVSLTEEQEEAADKVQEKYRSQLRSLNRDIQGLHTRLVSLEADKLVEIEKVLTKEQLAQLRASRQDSPAAPKLAIRKTEEPTKSE